MFPARVTPLKIFKIQYTSLFHPKKNIGIILSPRNPNRKKCAPRESFPLFEQPHFAFIGGFF